MRAYPLFLALGLSLCTAAAGHAQGSDRDSAFGEAPRDGLDGGSGLQAAAILADDVPLPLAPVVLPGRFGDRVLAPASGDPFFLQFASGVERPPAGERVSPQLLQQASALDDDGRPDPTTYALVMFSRRITDARKAELESLGCRILGFHPHYSLKVALPPEAIDAVASLSYVRWIGAAGPRQKVHPRLAATLARSQPGELVPVYVDVYESDLNPSSTPIAAAKVALTDLPGVQVAGGPPPATWRSNGWQWRALERMGLELTEYVESIRAFRCRLRPDALAALVALDLVQFVEPDLPAEPMHDESTPMILTDSTRASFTGGTNAVAIAGMADTGYDYGHGDLDHVFAVGFDFTTAGNPFADGNGHGSHVAGTLLGNGDGTLSYKGNAPGLGWGATGRFRAARIFNDAGVFCGASVASILTAFDGPYTDPNGNTSPRTHVTNHSWGTPGGGFVGTEADPRAIDDSVYNTPQLQCWAAGNSGAGGAGTLNEEASAKNAFTVGNVVDYREPAVGDPGNLWTSSSRGPCGDQRWKPNVCAPGRWIRSVQTGTAAGYTDKSGTSMATPHVAGLASQLADHYAFLRYAPARMASILMATAITKDDLLLSTPADPNLNLYGAGRVEAYRAHWGTAQLGWTNWGFDQTSATWFYGDFPVNAGATRLVVCLTYHEPAAAAGAGKALVNDYDLWIDGPQGGIDPGGNTGEYFSQQSTRDNTEIRSLDNPPAGAWRWKSWPTSVPGTAHVSVTVAVAYGDTTPDPNLALTASSHCVRPNENVTLTAAYSNPAFVASAVFLDSTSVGDAVPLQASSVTLMDGIVANLLTNQHLGRDLLLGDVVHGTTRTARWTTRWAAEGVHNWSVEARSDNATDVVDAINITVDGTPPAGPTGLGSPTHQAGVQSCNTLVNVTWTPAVDALSGLAGYAGVWDTQPVFDPPGPVNIGPPASNYAIDIGSSGTPRYFHLRAVDACGNWGTTVHFGPVLANDATVGTYCTGKVNSLGCVPRIDTTGAQPSLSAGNFTVICTSAINKKNGVLFWGRYPNSAPFQGGILCVKPPVQRTPVQPSGGSPTGEDCSGSYAFTFTTNYLLTYSLNPGDDAFAQWWMRDPGSPSSTGLSNALRFTICQ